ncbi:hypothetical protein BDV98DRAFT_657378 [Pterulicium gracile]|uniref:RlpA-like double-psi beta-barrel-protein domain-containing protein-containing protein n=1 Tax=Pterulicium gracile TaxID=1884261 RepID=A0A5C3QDK1_9AGAR|nr:hypothetical protein BDV98DRAFT_657378 [Pterula gracilis]
MKFTTSILTLLATITTAVSAAPTSPLTGPNVSVPGTEEYTHALEKRMTGDATWYDAAAGYTACGFLVANTSFTVAVSASRYDSSAVDGNPNNNRICRRAIRISGPVRQGVVAYIRDRCAGCGYDDIDLTPTLFEHVVGPLGLGRRQITWDFV